ncbi:MAG: class I SAM-dependent methyltransferase [Gemmatimonadaceae bacterium]
MLARFVMAMWLHAGNSESDSNASCGQLVRAAAHSVLAWRTQRDLRPSLIWKNFKARRFAPPPAIPPGRQLFAVDATRSVEWFLETGRQTADSFRTALTDIDRPIESFEAILDFGCGCGRVLRQWINVKGPIFFGTDYNPHVVDWASAHLPFDIRRNSLTPPLPYADETFDLCYAVSVFTHLPESQQRPWLKELHRILKPDGILLLTLSGEGDLIRTTPGEQEEFRTRGLVVLDGAYAGTNMCGVYHSESYVRKNWADF